MPEFDDVMQPPHYRPQLDYNSVNVIERYTVLLKDGETTATIYPVHSDNELPPGLLAFLCDEFNMEIERGDTFPFFDTLHIEAFQNYWFGSFAAVMVLGDSPRLEGSKQWEKECLGTFFIKPNYPGRSSHICTAGFLVNAGIRGKGIGRTLADCYLQWAPRLGYTYAIFNLVFETNAAARKIWESLNFKRIGRVKSAGILKGHDTAVDGIIYGKELINNADPAVGAYRFDKIKYYLETGRYPSMADRHEKSRLRSSASHYHLENGKLMLKGREVVSDPVKQLQICTEIHMTNHGGINKTTSIVTEKYHWTRIKDTVATAIKNCPECRESNKEPTLLKRNSIPKKMMTATSVIRRNKLLQSSPNNPNARNLLRSRNNPDDVEAMVAAAQLHNLPSQHRQDAAESLLSHDLSGLDDGIIAAVEAAQRSQQGAHQTHHPTYAAAAAAAVAGDANHFQQYQHDYTNAHEYHQVPNETHAHATSSTNKGRNRHNNIPVDPEVSAFDHHVESGGEIEIARALIQANEDVPEEGTHTHNDVDAVRNQSSGEGQKNDDSKRDVDDTNIFFKDNN
ncbi:Piso0_001377 [Millerozyma farinosa CBS 7064]|uniref:Piso0_001377 protein n=1 Tax=Pichia sorbitophila (strain ATCC MYA-4447 / BCRC 22081 / CBS 7064 / NBRC 10061 / NRRL Y-12695) TaxID=559304 RepID=G8YKM1_PICSO|nr:Piso0_001377 [Millerozyma farinosa CBS 7064]